jgi:hypothetical protein
MAKKKTQKNTIDSTFHALIGEVVVEFGRLEDAVRCSTAEIVCPAIGYPVNLSLFARTGFSELIDLYDFIISYALQEAEDADRLKPEDKDRIEAARQIVRKQLTSANERRNRVIHSSYMEVEHLNASDLKPFDITLEALKPLLHRRALDVTETFNPFENIHEDIVKLIADIKAAYQDFLIFDNHLIAYRYVMWEPFCTRLSRDRK